MCIPHLKEHMKYLEETLKKIKSEEKHLSKQKENIQKELDSLKDYLTLPYLQREKAWIQHMVKDLLKNEKEIDSEIMKLQS